MTDMSVKLPRRSVNGTTRFDVFYGTLGTPVGHCCGGRCTAGTHSTRVPADVQTVIVAPPRGWSVGPKTREVSALSKRARGQQQRQNEYQSGQHPSSLNLLPPPSQLLGCPALGRISDAGPSCDSVNRIALISDKAGDVVIEAAQTDSATFSF